MPKSRGRKKKTTPPRPGRPGLTPQQRRMLGLLAAADAAEARGDVAAALDVIGRQPRDEEGRVFWRPWRVARLEQLIMLEPFLPPWAISRWILDQAAQGLDPSMRRGHAVARAVAVELRGGRAALPGSDEIDAMSRVMDNDWVYRQLLIFDHGALAAFLKRGAAADLVAGADRIQEWVGVPMRAFRFEGREPTVLHWTDLATGELVDVPNLGAAVLMLPGEHAIGRLVPTSAGPMFEGIPLGVPPEVAAAVAADPGDWVGALRRGDPGDPERPSTAIVRGNHLVSDVPDTVWHLVVLNSVADRDPGVDVRDVFTRGAVGVVRAAMAGELEALVHGIVEGVDPWPCLAAMFCEPRLLELLAHEFGPSDVAALMALSERLFGPGGAVCRELAAAALAAA